MNNFIKLLYTFCFLLALTSCEENIEESAINIVNTDPDPTPIGSVTINPVDINEKGFDLLEKMQGHWIGMNRVINIDYPWFSFDYRAISPSHIHGIYEGGTQGNLLTSFFVSEFKGKRTIMARNGGDLNGIYRASYFVLDSVNQSTNGDYYRLVDAVGGIGTMSMELRFKNDSLYFNAYTSKLGAAIPPSRHMTFKAKKFNLDLSNTAATTVNFPQNIIEKDFSNGFVQENLWVNTGDTQPRSATFLEFDKDPFTILEHPYLGYLNVKVIRNPAITNKVLFVYLSKESLTDANGFLQADALQNSLLKFPEIIKTQNEFLFTYLHPGTYYVTIIADVNENGFIDTGDITHVSQTVTITPEQQQEITIDNITIQN